MSFGLHLTIEGRGRSFERFFPRPPVLIGREVAHVQCGFEDSMVSKLHASLDLRGDTIFVRDVTSTNGVYVAGKRIEPGRWLPLVPSDQVGLVQIANWKIRVQRYALDSIPSSVAGTLATFVEEEEAAAASARGLPAAEHTVAGVAGMAPKPAGRPAEVPPQAPPVVDRTLALRDQQDNAQLRALLGQLPASYVAAIAAIRALFETTSRILAAAPRESRASMCQGLATSYPLILVDPSFVALFRHYGWTASTSAGAPIAPLAGSTLEAMQELARWYLGTDRVLASPSDVAAFKEKLRTSLDELVLGYAPLVAGLDRFESEMALRREATAGPRSPAEMARQLLEWTAHSDEPLRRMRASFADLMMHQVALLNGVMRGVMTLLTELAPAMIEKSAQRKTGRTFFLFRLFRRSDPWSVYKERHSDLTSEEQERFHLLFGADFAEEYRQFARETRSSASASPPPIEGVAKLSLPPPPAVPWIPGQGPSNSGRR
jgi:type VI secretion system protein ImpI